VAAPVQSVAIASLYTLGGWLLFALAVSLDLPYLVYPLAMGFALVAPFVAVAFYAVSRQLETAGRATIGETVRLTLDARHRDLRWMALITSFAFFIWMDIAAMLTLGFFGAAALDFAKLVSMIFTTPEGWTFLFVGHLMGAVIALLVFSVSAISIPLLFDRDIDVMTAMMTSVRFVRANPLVMVMWCATIAMAIAISLLSGLVLLCVALPVIGYATWHLYRRAVAGEAHQ